jgi:hypothetical protein
MIPRKELRKLVRDRLRDAQVLCENRRYAGAVYLCGYAVELALKARICRTLKWQGFPETQAEMRDYRSFIVHNLDALLHLSGVEAQVKTRHRVSWDIVATWDPQLRYQPIRHTTEQDARNMIQATMALMQVLR